MINVLYENQTSQLRAYSGYSGKEKHSSFVKWLVNLCKENKDLPVPYPELIREESERANHLLRKSKLAKDRKIAAETLKTNNETVETLTGMRPSAVTPLCPHASGASTDKALSDIAPLVFTDSDTSAANAIELQESQALDSGTNALHVSDLAKAISERTNGKRAKNSAFGSGSINANCSDRFQKIISNRSILNERTNKLWEYVDSMIDDRKPAAVYQINRETILLNEAKARLLRLEEAQKLVSDQKSFTDIQRKKVDDDLTVAKQEYFDFLMKTPKSG